MSVEIPHIPEKGRTYRNNAVNRAKKRKFSPSKAPEPPQLNESDPILRAKVREWLKTSKVEHEYDEGEIL